MSASSSPPGRGRLAGAGDADARPASALAQTGQLLRWASHPRRAFLTAGCLAAAAGVGGREPREVALVGATVLLGQVVLGWHNDVVDRTRDRAALDVDELHAKPLAHGSVPVANAWFAIVCAVLVLVPLSLTNGVVAGSWYLGSVVVGLLGNLVLRRSWLSFLPWAAAFAAYAPFLSYGVLPYGGWGGEATGGPPAPALVGLAALLGVGVHVLGALPDLVQDNRVGYRHLPLRIALRTGATRLLVVAVLWTAAATAGLVTVASASGLHA